MAYLWRDFWIRETGTGQQVAQLHDRWWWLLLLPVGTRDFFPHSEAFRPAQGTYPASYWTGTERERPIRKAATKLHLQPRLRCGVTAPLPDMAVLGALGQIHLYKKKSLHICMTNFSTTWFSDNLAWKLCHWRPNKYRVQSQITKWQTNEPVKLECD